MIADRQALRILARSPELGGLFGADGAVGHRGHHLVQELRAHVAGGEHAGHLGRARLIGHDVSRFVALQRAAQKLGVGLGAHGHEQAVHRDVALLARLEHLEAHAGQLALVGHELVGHRVPDELDVRQVLQALVVDGRGAQLVAAVHEVHLLADARQVDGVARGRVAAAHHHDLLVAEEVAVARGAVRHAAALQVLLELEPQLARARARGDDHALGAVLVERRPLWLKSTDTTSSPTLLAPKRSACCFIAKASSKPLAPSGKPG